jgi:hypothetical protein
VIELTDQQADAVELPELAPLRLFNPRTQETFVLLRGAEYQRLKEDEYDDSPWTSEELMALAWEAGKNIGWDEDYPEYDDEPVTSWSVSHIRADYEERNDRPSSFSLTFTWERSIPLSSRKSQKT